MNKEKVLIVDDVSENIQVVGAVLKKLGLKLSFAQDGKTAIEIIKKVDFDLILLDIMMPEMTGFEVCDEVKKIPEKKDIPIVFLTAKIDEESISKAFDIGGVDYIKKPFNKKELVARVKNHLRLKETNDILKNENDYLDREVRKRTKEVYNTRLEIIRRLGRASEYRDNETGLHIIRMSKYCKVLAKNYNVDEKMVELIYLAAPMHDIGKIGIPDNILIKPGKLDKDEWKIMKRHAKIGGEIIGEHDSDLLKYSKIVAETHHEKWNGKGYPRGLTGENIPLIGRIAAVADVFDALTSVRPYKEAWPVEKAVKLINEEAGEHFDPSLVEVFNTSLDELLEIKEKFKEE